MDILNKLGLKNKGIQQILNNKVVKAGSWYTFTNFFTKGVAFLTIPIFTRLLTPADYGVTSLYASWLSILTVIMSLDLMGSIGRGKFDFKEDYDGFASSVAFLSFLIFLIFSIILFTFRNTFSAFMGLDLSLFYILIFHSFFGFILSFTNAKFRFEYKYKIVSLVTILTSLVGVALSIYFIFNIFETNRALGKISGQFLPISIIGSFYFIFLLSKGKKFINLKYWKYALLLSIPLIPHNLSGIINAQFDRIIIDRFLGNAPTGIYSFAYNVGMIVTVLLGAANTAWVPWFYEKMENNEYLKIKKRGNLYRDLFTMAYGAILMFSPELIKIMAEESYWEGLIIIPYVFGAYYFQFLYTFEVNVEFFLKKPGLISIGTILSAAINVVLNIWLIPIFGYIAAAVTTLISYIFLFIFHYLMTNKIIKKTVYGIRFHLISILYVTIITLYFMLFQSMLLPRLIGLLGILGYFYFSSFRKYLKD
ncbi:oligosaccharide flippase family protein [Petrotoga sp. DB-2]